MDKIDFGLILVGLNMAQVDYKWCLIYLGLFAVSSKKFWSLYGHYENYTINITGKLWII